MPKHWGKREFFHAAKAQRQGSALHITSINIYSNLLPIGSMVMEYVPTFRLIFLWDKCRAFLSYVRPEGCVELRDYYHGITIIYNSNLLVISNYSQGTTLHPK